MIAAKLIEQIVTNIHTTYNTMTGIDNLYVASVIDTARESVLNKRSQSGDKSVPAQLLQYLDLYYDETIQPYGTDNSYTVYLIPRLAQISAAITAPITIAKTQGVSYPLYTSIQMYETMNRNAAIIGMECVVWINNSAGDQVRLYGERRNQLRAQAVLASPLKLETFNLMKDEYPVSAGMISAIEQEIVALYMRNLQAQAPRFVRDIGVK